MDERRSEPRIKQPFLIHFRQVNPKPLNDHWDIVSSLNISKSGICFNSIKRYEPGVELEVRISNPLTQTKSVFLCSVIRSDDLDPTRKLSKTVIKLEGMSQEAQDAFHKSIDLYLLKYRDQ